jgi:GNAT superfamily N-acetyltransferase
MPLHRFDVDLRMTFSHRLATLDDVPVLKPLMNAAIAELLKPVLSPEQVQASFSVMGLDTQLIKDGTYFVIAEDGRIAGCGGWSRRATLFGGDHSAGREARMLDPKTEAARVRAMYTHPDFTRRGIGRMILALCEEAARREGFGEVELAATMAGLPLYRACGYRDIEAFEADTPSGVKVPLVRMGKPIHTTISPRG